MKFCSTVVEKRGGVPTIVAAGEALHGHSATSVAFRDADVVRDFAASGVEIFLIWIEIGIKCWRSEGQYDWSYAEERLRFFEEHSGDSKWIIRIRLGLVAEWFGQTYPDEVHSMRPDLSVCVIHSSVWRNRIETLLRDFTAWVQTTQWAGRIIGFMLNAGATEEWLPFDTEAMFTGTYHPVMAREFRGWLRETYNDDAGLRAAWRDESANLENAAPPTGMMRKGSHIWGLWTLRDPLLERPAIDYYRFLNERLADTLIGFCRVVKETATEPVLCGGFHSYLWWETGVYSYIQEYGHGLIQKVSASPYVDFASDITSYDGRYPGGPSGYLGLPASLNLHNTLHYTEVDLHTVKNLTPEQRAAWDAADKSQIPLRSAEPALPDREWKWPLGMCGRDEAEQSAVLQREAAHNIITGTPYWWFDIKGHDYQPPSIQDTLRQMTEIGKQAVGRDRTSRAEIAFICSEETPMYQSAMNGSLLRFEMEGVHDLLLDGCTRRWGLAGIPFDTYELNDLEHEDFPDYKALIFVNCAHVSERSAAAIRRQQKSGRTQVWTYASACIADDGFDAARGEELIGLRLGCRRERQNMHVMFDGSGHDLTSFDCTLLRGARNFGTEGSVGPVFFANDPAARVLGTLRDGGEAACAVREHGSGAAAWRSVYFAMLNFGPEVLRNLAKAIGAHVWCETDDVVYANASLLCFHASSGGAKTIHLPPGVRATDAFSGGDSTEGPIHFDTEAYRTRLWWLAAK